MLTSTHFHEILRKQTSSKRFCIAFSGGLDSSVLLHLFFQLLKIEPDLNLRVIHINHGISDNANEWALACERICNGYRLPLIIEKINIQKESKESLEDLARRGRHHVFKQMLEKEEVLVTAHHQNDQAETLLLQLFRGAGPRGLSAMPSIASFGKGFLLRPLLQVTRDVLQAYAMNENLDWLEDESNQNCNFDRNYVRHYILPVIEQRWPAITETLARAASHCAEADEYIENQIIDAFKLIFNKENKSLSIPGLLSYKEDKQKFIIRYWLRQLGFPLPSTQKLSILLKEILACRQDALPILRWQNVEIRRYSNDLYAILPLLPHDPSIIIKWDMQKDLVLPHLGMLRLSEIAHLNLTDLEKQQVSIRFRQGGERCRLINRTHSHSLKKLFQYWRIPPWQRDRVPLLYIENKLRAIIGYAVCAE